MTDTPKFSYKLRPGYGSKDLLLDFNAKQSADQLQAELISILENNGFKFESAEDLWMNDELLFNFSSQNGAIVLSRDIWDFIFVHGDKNQADIFKIDALLSANSLFEKLPVDFSEYK